MGVVVSERNIDREELAESGRLSEDVGVPISGSPFGLGGRPAQVSGGIAGMRAGSTTPFGGGGRIGGISGGRPGGISGGISGGRSGAINGGISGVSNSGGFTGTSGGIGGGISGGRVGGISGNLAAGAQGGYVDSGSEIRSRKQSDTNYSINGLESGAMQDGGHLGSDSSFISPYVASPNYEQYPAPTYGSGGGAAQVLGGGIGGY